MHDTVKTILLYTYIDIKPIGSFLLKISIFIASFSSVKNFLGGMFVVISNYLEQTLYDHNNATPFTLIAIISLKTRLATVQTASIDVVALFFVCTFSAELNAVLTVHSVGTFYPKMFT